MAQARGILFPLVLAAALFGGLAYWTSSQQAEELELARAAAAINNGAPPRPVAEVASAVAAMKLVTVEIDTTVKIERGNESWRGNVLASIDVPVRLSYGVDLSTMTIDSLAWSPTQDAYVIGVAAPIRVATQIFSERAPPQVQLGWLRLRSVAGEYFLSQARKDAPVVAASLELLPQDALKVETTSKEQLKALVQKIVGKDVGVIIQFRPAARDDQGGRK
jgi:hypothetical protein